MNGYLIYEWENHAFVVYSWCMYRQTDRHVHFIHILSVVRYFNNSNCMLSINQCFCVPDCLCLSVCGLCFIVFWSVRMYVLLVTSEYVIFLRTPGRMLMSWQSMKVVGEKWYFKVVSLDQVINTYLDLVLVEVERLCE